MQHFSALFNLWIRNISARKIKRLVKCKIWVKSSRRCNRARNRFGFISVLQTYESNGQTINNAFPYEMTTYANFKRKMLQMIDLLQPLVNVLQPILQLLLQLIDSERILICKLCIRLNCNDQYWTWWMVIELEVKDHSSYSIDGGHEISSS